MEQQTRRPASGQGGQVLNQTSMSGCTSGRFGECSIAPVRCGGQFALDGVVSTVIRVRLELIIVL